MQSCQAGAAPLTHQAVSTEHRPQLVPLRLVLARVILHSSALAVRPEVKAASALQVDWGAVLVHRVWVNPAAQASSISSISSRNRTWMQSRAGAVMPQQAVTDY